MRRIIEANIKRFNELLKIEADPAKLEVLTASSPTKRKSSSSPRSLKQKPIRH